MRPARAGLVRSDCEARPRRPAPAPDLLHLMADSAHDSRDPLAPPDLSFGTTLRHLLSLWCERVAAGVDRARLRARLHLRSRSRSRCHPARDRRRDRARDQRPLWPTSARSSALALIRFTVNFPRRYATARIGIAIEAGCASCSTTRYLRYPRAFYDRHATGQVVSRATNDLYPIRYFIGWGVVQSSRAR